MAYSDARVTTLVNALLEGRRLQAAILDVLQTAGIVTAPVGAPGGSVSTGALTSVNSAATSANVIAANAARKGLLAFNTDENAVLLKYGTTASVTSFTVRLPSNGYWEMPQPVYTGAIDAIWEADGSGALKLTEL